MLLLNPVLLLCVVRLFVMVLAVVTWHRAAAVPAADATVLLRDATLLQSDVMRLHPRRHSLRVAPGTEMRERCTAVQCAARGRRRSRPDFLYFWLRGHGTKVSRTAVGCGVARSVRTANKTTTKHGCRRARRSGSRVDNTFDPLVTRDAPNLGHLISLGEVVDLPVHAAGDQQGLVVETSRGQVVDDTLVADEQISVHRAR